MGKQRGGRRPPKHADALGLARRCLDEGRYRDTRHVVERREQRSITLLEVKEVIRSGWQEAAKDDYRPEYGAWNYAVRGRTLDRRSLRVVISFERDETGELLLLITAIDLDA